MQEKLELKIFTVKSALINTDNQLWVINSVGQIVFIQPLLRSDPRLPSALTIMNACSVSVRHIYDSFHLQEQPKANVSVRRDRYFLCSNFT